MRAQGPVTPERFAQGRTFAEYLDYIGTPENLARESGWWLGKERRDLSGIIRSWYERLRLSDAQAAAVRWLAAQPGGPAKILAISEEWSSDCRRISASSPASPRQRGSSSASSIATAGGSEPAPARIPPSRPMPIS